MARLLIARGYTLIALLTILLMYSCMMKFFKVTFSAAAIIRKQYMFNDDVQLLDRM